MNPRLLLRVGLALAATLVPDAALAQSSRPRPTPTVSPRARSTFASTLVAVRTGMTQAQVRAITGAPDDVLTRLDAALSPTSIVSELWSYGADAHGAFPSLGSVAFDGRGRVFSIHGASATPPSIAVSEPELRAHFARLSAVPGLSGGAFDPRPLVRAVNALHPLSESAALDVIAEYLRVAPPWLTEETDGVFLVLRSLFVPRARGAAHPPMHVGAPEPALPNPALALMFPLAIVDDVPLLLVSGYMLGGQPEQPAAHLAWYRSNAVRRAAPLSPRPERAWNNFAASPLGQSFVRVADTAGKIMLMEQVLRLVSDAYRPPLAQGTSHFDATTDPAPRFATMMTELAQLRLAWSDAQGMRSQRAVAPASVVAAPRAQRLRWEHVTGGASIEVLLQRVSPDVVRVWAHPTRRRPGASLPATVLELRGGASSTLLWRGEFSTSSLETYSVSELALATGLALTARITQGAVVVTSPQLTP